MPISASQPAMRLVQELVARDRSVAFGEGPQAVQTEDDEDPFGAPGRERARQIAHQLTSSAYIAVHSAQ